MTDTPKKRGRPRKSTTSSVAKAPQNKQVKVSELPPVSVNFNKKPEGLRGIINTGTIFIGDTGYFAANSQDYPEGIIEDDPTNPFKDWDKFHASHQNDCALELPGSFNGDLPGRGVVIQTNMLSGSYSVEKEECPNTGKLLSIKVVFRE